MKRIIYLAAGFALLGLVTSCEHNDIFETMEFSVQLAPQNTYLAGDPVVFSLGGNADFITVWNGDTGHEYKYRDRTLAPEQFRSAELQLEISQQYNTPGLEIYMTDRFDGLGGRVFGNDNANAAADGTSIQRIIDSDFAGWDKFAFDVKNDGKFYAFKADISRYKDNFTLLLRYKTAPDGKLRTYNVNPKIGVEFDKYGSRTWKFADLSFVPYRTAGLYTDTTPYVCSTADDLKDIFKVNQNGLVKFANGANPIPGTDIAFQGFTAGDAVNAGSLPGVKYQAVDQWVVMNPMKLYSVSADTGANIKGVTDDVRTYEHTYDQPGTYTATFIVSKGNYQGESGRVVREVTFTIAEKLGR